MLAGCRVPGTARVLISSSLLQGTLQRSGVVQQSLSRAGAAAQFPSDSGGGSRNRIRVPVAPASPAGDCFSFGAAAVDVERQQEAGSLAHGCIDDSEPVDATAAPHISAATAAPAVMLSAPAAAVAVAAKDTVVAREHERSAPTAAVHQTARKRRLPTRITRRDEAMWHASAAKRPATAPLVQVHVSVNPVCVTSTGMT